MIQRFVLMDKIKDVGSISIIDILGKVFDDSKVCSNGKNKGFRIHFNN